MGKARLAHCKNTKQIETGLFNNHLLVLVWKQIYCLSELWRSFRLFIFTFHKSTAFNLIVSAKFKGFRTQAIKNDIEQRKEYCVVRLNTPCRQI